MHTEPASSFTTYRDEEWDFRAILKACDEPASQHNPDWDKIFNIPEYNIFQQISPHSTSSGIFAFGETAEAAKRPEMHHEKVLCFYPHRLFGVDGNAEHPNTCERAASLERRTELAFENDSAAVQ